ncbi:hypothetical protein [Halomonas halocynthiae]|nr:hypothetical protein [Halomonas halocynthiae]
MAEHDGSQDSTGIMMFVLFLLALVFLACAPAVAKLYVLFGA